MQFKDVWRYSRLMSKIHVTDRRTSVCQPTLSIKFQASKLHLKIVADVLPVGRTAPRRMAEEEIAIEQR